MFWGLPLGRRDDVAQGVTARMAASVMQETRNPHRTTSTVTRGGIKVEDGVTYPEPSGVEEGGDEDGGGGGEGGGGEGGEGGGGGGGDVVVLWQISLQGLRTHSRGL